MKEGHESDGVRKWQELDHDILVTIFKKLSVSELTSGLAHVCRGWRVACCDPFLWKTLDLSHMRSVFIRTPYHPYVHVCQRSDQALTRILKLSMNLSGGCTETLIFHFDLFLTNDQLTYTAQRCQGLRRLVLPAWNRLNEIGICEAIRIWKDLESLTMPSLVNLSHLLKGIDLPYVMTEITKNCKNFKELKIMGPFFFAETLVACLPNLKTLSLRCSAIEREALVKILDGLPSLEVLNISHCHLVEFIGGRDVRELDETIMEKALRLKRFLTCMEKETCVMCQRSKYDEGIERWYKYEEGAWKVDEVTSLHL